MLVLMAQRIDFLEAKYEPDYFYWEVVEMTRKMTFVGPLSFMMPGEDLQPMFGALIALTYLLLQVAHA